jgi:23S rRNA pseudouridine2605 synthase
MPAEIGQKVGPGDEVRINGEPVKIRFAEPKPRVLVYHKPAGELVTRDDPEERPTVFDDLPSIRDGKWIAVGRLDYNTEGLLLFTNSGELANRLMHPRYEVEREYAVRVMGRLSDEQTHDLMTGVDLEDGPAKVEKLEDGGGDEDSANHWYNVTLKEGRNREVRRLFEAIGLTVSRLLRTRYGRIAMPPSLKRGEVVEMEPPDVNALLKSVGLKPSAGGATAEQGAGTAPRPQGKPRPPGQGQPRQGQRGRRRGPPGAAHAQAGGGQGQSQQEPGQEGTAQRQGQRGSPSGGGQRGAKGNGKRHGARAGQGGAAGKGGGKHQRRGPRDGNVQVALTSHGAGAEARGAKAKRRRGRGKPNQNAQPGVVRDRRVGLLPPGADGRVPPMPVVTHKKRRTVVPEGATPWDGTPRDED